MNYKSNRKGEFMLDILVIILLLVLFFNLQGGLSSMITEMTALTNDSFVIWMLRGFLFFLLMGIGKYIMDIGRVTE